MWMSISDLARERGVSKQGISKNLKRWASAGRAIPTKKSGRETLIKVVEYDLALGQVGDQARILGEATKKGFGPAGVSPVDPDAPVYTREQARAKQYEADIKEIELEKLRGELVEVSQLRDAATAAAESMLRAIDQMPARAEDLSVATKMPVAQCRVFLKTAARDLRQRVTDVFAGLAARAMTADDQQPEEAD